MRHLSFYPKSLERGCRSEKALKLAIAEMYVTGVSTRKVSQITEQLCGTEISATQVSRIAKMLDEELKHSLYVEGWTGRRDARGLGWAER